MKTMLIAIAIFVTATGCVHLSAQDANTADRETLRSELKTLADQVVLPRAFNLIHQIVGPSVVSIHTSERVQLTRWGRPVATREMEMGEGSGFVFFSNDDASWVVTNAHVTMRLDRRQRFVIDSNTRQPVAYDAIKITTIDGAMHEATPVGADIQTDLAVLRIDVPNLPAITWGDSDHAQVGDYVVALGHPLEVGYSATFGNVSATDRSTGIYENQSGYESFIQTDAAINPGNSGGPLVDLRGRVIGVNANIVTRGGGNVGIGFAIPANLAQRVAEDLRDDGKVSRPMVGIQMTALANAEAEQLGVPNRQAVRITLVVPGSPAETAGLRDGDVIVAVDEVEVSGTQQLRSRIAAARIDDELVLRIWRSGDLFDVVVIPMSREDLDQAMRSQAAEHNATTVVWPGYGLTLRKDAFRGAVIDQVTPGSIADREGLSTDDRVLRILPDTNLDDFQAIAALDNRRELVLQIYRDGRQFFVQLAQ